MLYQRTPFAILGSRIPSHVSFSFKAPPFFLLLPHHLNGSQLNFGLFSRSKRRSRGDDCTMSTRVHLGRHGEGATNGLQSKRWADWTKMIPFCFLGCQALVMTNDRSTYLYLWKQDSHVTVLSHWTINRRTRQQETSEFEVFHIHTSQEPSYLYFESEGIRLCRVGFVTHE